MLNRNPGPHSNSASPQAARGTAMDVDPEPLRMYPALGAEHASCVVLPAVRQVSAVSTSHPCWLEQAVQAVPPEAGSRASPNEPGKQEHSCVPGPVCAHS